MQLTCAVEEGEVFFVEGAVRARAVGERRVLFDGFARYTEKRGVGVLTSEQRQAASAFQPNGSQSPRNQLPRIGLAHAEVHALVRGADSEQGGFVRAFEDGDLFGGLAFADFEDLRRGAVNLPVWEGALEAVCDE